MSDLNARIKAWRNAFASEMSAAELDELEDHLREMLACLPEDALNLDERFLVATHRLGAPGAIVAEFKKADPSQVWRERVLWLLGGFAAVQPLSVICRYLVYGYIELLGIRDPDDADLVMYVAGTGCLLLVACLLTALIRNERRTLVVAGRVAQMPGVLKGIVMAAGALLLLDTPGGLATLLRPTMAHMDGPQLLTYSGQMYYLALGNHVMNVFVVIGLIAAAPWLAGHEQGRKAALGETRLAGSIGP
jgi:hypothetical protein